MAEEAMQSAAQAATGAAAAAARGAIDIFLSGGAFGGFTFSLKIDNPWLAAGIAIGTFYIANKALTERAIRNALQQQTSSTANADPEVTSISTGSILVQLHCYSEESFLRFTDDIDSKKAKYRLEEELATVGFREEIRLTVENKKQLELFRQKLFPVSVSPQEDKVALSSDLMPRRHAPSSPVPKKVKRQQFDDSHPQESGRTVDREEMKFYTVEVNYSRWEVPERYDSFQSLGYDTHGQLCAAIDKQSQESVVIKKLDRPFDSLISCINTFREMRLLKHTKHDTIIHFHDLFTPQKTLREFSSVYLVYKSLPPPSFSLEQILSTQITDDHLKFIAYALFRALLYLHSMELVLLDLAPQHIFVNESLELQIQNLASARKVGVYGPYDNKMSGYVGLRWYRAPEMILNIGDYDGKVDVWSVGCILYKLATGKVLFPGKDHINQLTVIIDVLGTPNKALIEKCSFEAQGFLSGLPLKERSDLSEYLQPSNASAGFVAFLERILVMDPSERISAAEALRDPYLEEYHDPDDEPLAEPFDDSFEQWKDLGKDEWKERIFDEIRNFVA